MTRGGAMKKGIFEKLFILEMANNHMGDVEHGLKVIRAFHEVTKKYDFKFGFKLQYRNLDTFIHPKYKGSQDIKYVKRFEDTRLSKSDLRKLRDEMVKLGFTAICTPFDESSVDLILEHEFDVIKVASCSFTDWPLLEKIGATNKPVILSTAGASVNDIDRVVAFFEHRDREFAIMHCVGEYPTAKENFELNQIAFLKARYPNLTIGYSTHEPPEEMESVKLAVGEGAEIFERHIGLKTDKFSINNYSSMPEQIGRWLESATDAFLIAGVKNERRKISDKEKDDLVGLRRGVFVKENLRSGDKLSLKNIFFAIPNIKGQLLANDFSKYMEYSLKKDLLKDEPVMTAEVSALNLREKFLEISNKIKDMVIKSHVPLPLKFDFELSHHYGIENFEKIGATIIRCINREYCKTIIITLPGQKNPTHYHKKKEETFQVLYGDLILEMSGVEKEYRKGDIIVVERGVPHSFTSKGGAIFEEVSTTHYKEDSFYEDPKVLANKNRKTEMTFWSDWFNKPLS